MKSFHATYGNSSNNKDSVVVGKDNDGLIATMSVETCLALPESAKKIINSKEHSEEKRGYREMFDACVDLMVHFYQTAPHKLQNLDNPELNDLFKKNTNSDLETVKSIMKNCVKNNFNVENFGAGRPYDCYLAFKLNTSRHNFENLSPQWIAATQKYQISDKLAVSYRETTKEEDNTISFRLDPKSALKSQRTSAAKPAYIWLKVGNWGPFRNNHIPVNQKLFGKTNDFGDVVPGAHTAQTAHPEKYPDIISTKPIKFSLQELVDGVKDGTFLLDEKLSTDDRMAFRCAPNVNSNPKNIDTIFSIDMNADSRSLLSNIQITDSKDEEYIEYLKNNAGWNEKWGEIGNALNFEFNLQANTNGDENSFSNVEEFVIPVKDNPQKRNVFSPVQHSFENYNPYIQSNVNSPAIFVGPEGIPTVKQDYRGMTQYLLENCSNQVFHINPNWNLTYSLGGQLVENQLNLATKHMTNENLPVPIVPSTIAAYMKQMINDNQNFNLELFSNIVKISAKIRDEGKDARVQVCNYLTHHIEKAGIIPCKRDTLKIMMNSLTRDAAGYHRLDPNPAADALSHMTDVTAKARANRIEKNTEQKNIDLHEKDAESNVEDQSNKTNRM